MAMVDFFSTIGLISGLLTIVVFLTGKPSIYHFLPVKDINILSFISPLNIKWKFFVKEEQLYIRSNSLEIPLAIDLKKYSDYKILKSTTAKRFLIFSKKHGIIFIINNDGKNRNEHKFNKVIDIKWVSDTSFVLALSGSSVSNNLEKASVFLKEDRVPTNNSGVFLVEVDNENEIIKINHY